MSKIVIPVSMDLQDIAQQNFAKINSVQKRQIKDQLKSLVEKITMKGNVYISEDVKYMPAGRIAFVDTTEFYKSDDYDPDCANISDFSDMFNTGKIEDEHGTVFATYETDITGDSCRRYDIDRCLAAAENNLAKLQSLIDAVKQAKAQGAKHFAFIDLNDYEADN